MMNRATFFKIASAGLFSGVLTLNLLGAPTAPETNAPPQSVFIMPDNAKQGRDPFFPKSTRPYENSMPVVTTDHTDLTGLVMEGVSGPPDHRLAIINNVTFGAGDTAEVRTPQGRLRIHCVEVNENSAVIEVRGQFQELHYHQP